MVDSDVGFLQAVALLTTVVHSDVAARFSVFKAYDVATMKLKLSADRVVSLPEWDNLPFLIVLRNVGFKLLEEILWVAAALRGLRAELARDRLVSSYSDVQIR